MLGVARELGIGLVPFSPLGRGFLTGAITSPATSATTTSGGTSRASRARPSPPTCGWSTPSASWRREKGATPGQLALAWVLAQGEDVVPIPGTKRRSYLEENAGAGAVELSADDLARLDAIGSAEGTRYPDAGYAYGDSPERAG